VLWRAKQQQVGKCLLPFCCTAPTTPIGSWQSSSVYVCRPAGDNRRWQSSSVCVGYLVPRQLHSCINLRVQAQLVGFLSATSTCQNAAGWFCVGYVYLQRGGSCTPALTQDLAVCFLHCSVPARVQCCCSSCVLLSHLRNGRAGGPRKLTGFWYIQQLKRASSYRFCGENGSSACIPALAVCAAAVKLCLS
jgi:hypothetical protein